MNRFPSSICILMLVVIGVATGLGSQFVTNNNLVVEPIIISKSISSFSQKITNAQTYISHAPILITSNTQFSSQNFSGSGTQDDPYRIEGLNITALANELIKIQDTTVHVLIRDNFLNGLATDSSAIFLSNVNNIKIEDNFIVNNTDGLTIDSSSNITCDNNDINYNYDGIHITNASDIVILNNTVFSNTRLGIVLISSQNCLISFNTIDDNLINGVHLRYTYNTTIISNDIYNRGYSELSQSGILLDNSSSSLIANNSIFNNHYGINLLNSSDSNIITNNTIYNNQQHGIRIEYSSNNFITYTEISDNVFYGILITFGSNDNIIRFNAFTGNHIGGSQATDDGANNIFSGNYWDDWSSPDANEDLIVDNPYPIDGSANNSDSYPLVEFSIEAIENAQKTPNYLGILLFFLIILTILGGSIGLGYLTSKMLKPILRLNQQAVKSDFEIEESFTEFTPEELIDRLTPLYHKLVVGVENIQTSTLPQPITLPLLEPAEPITLVDYFPSDIKEDLWSGMKWRTVLTLIEIAYQDPSETNVVNLAKSMDIPRSTLSKEIKRLNDLQYIESLVTTKVMQDARYRNYTITPKGFIVLYVLKEAFKMAIKRIKEKREDF